MKNKGVLGSLKYTFINKKTIKLVKLILISTRLEKIILLMIVILMPLQDQLFEIKSPFTQQRMIQLLQESYNKKEFNKIENIDQYYTWLKNNVVSTYYSPKITSNKPIYKIRVRQFRIPLNCESDNENCMKAIHQKQEIEDKQFIGEWRIGDESMVEQEGIYGEYKMNRYWRQVGNTQEANVLQSINWIDNRTIGLLTELVVFNCWSSSMVHVRFLLEMHKGQMTNHDWSIDQILIRDEGYLQLLTILLLLQVTVYLLKVMAEFHIYFNPLLFLAQTFYILSQLLFCLCSLLQLSHQSTLKTHIHNQSPLSFLPCPLTLYYINQKYLIFFYLILAMVYPFKLLQLLFWIKRLTLPAKFANLLYRTIPGLAIFVSILALLTFVFSIGLNFLFATQESLLLTFLNLLILNTPFFNQHSLNHKLYFQLYLVIQKVIQSLILIYFIAFFHTLFKQSFKIEIKAQNNFIKRLHFSQGRLQVKFDKVIQKLKKTLETKKNVIVKERENEKIVIMLESRKEGEGQVYEGPEQLMDVEFLEDLDEGGVTMSFFQKGQEVVQFLEYLFKARPGLLNQNADNIFRMVVYIHGRTSRDCAYLVNWLKNEGCKAPILVYSHQELYAGEHSRLTEQYANILFVTDPTILTQFCKMTLSMKQLHEKYSLVHSVFHQEVSQDEILIKFSND